MKYVQIVPTSGEGIQWMSFCWLRYFCGRKAPSSNTCSCSRDWWYSEEHSGKADNELECNSEQRKHRDERRCLKLRRNQRVADASKRQEQKSSSNGWRTYRQKIVCTVCTPAVLTCGNCFFWKKNRMNFVNMEKRMHRICYYSDIDDAILRTTITKKIGRTRYNVYQRTQFRILAVWTCRNCAVPWVKL